MIYQIAFVESEFSTFVPFVINQIKSIVCPLYTGKIMAVSFTEHIQIHSMCVCEKLYE